MATRTPGTWLCSGMWKLFCYTCATDELQMCHTCAFVCCIGALKHWTHWTHLPNKGWMHVRWLFGGWAMSWFSTLAAPLEWSGQNIWGAKGKRTRDRERRQESNQNVQMCSLKIQQNVCRNQDGVLVTAPNALEQNLRRLVSLAKSYEIIVDNDINATFCHETQGLHLSCMLSETNKKTLSVLLKYPCSIPLSLHGKFWFLHWQY